MRQEVRAFAAALVLYGLFYAAFFYQSFVSGHYIAPSDSLDFGVAAYLSSPALWTQGMYSGYPIAADPQSLTWYPILHLFRLLGLDWNLFLIAAYVIASATCYLLVRRITGSAVAGAFSGFVYGFNGLMLGYIGNFNQIHAASWMPLALYGLQLTREGLTRRGTAVASMAFALMWLAGHPQIVVYAAYLFAALLIGWLLLDRLPGAILLARGLWSAGAMGLGFALAAIVILPMLELGEFSRRAESTWDLYIAKAIPPWELLGLVLPFSFGGFRIDSDTRVPYLGEGGDTAYVGLLALALALAAPFVLSRHRREARLWMGIAVVEVLLCVGPATPIGALFFYAPGYASFRGAVRHLFVVSLCIAVASGLALAELTRRREDRRVIAAAVSATCVLAAMAFAAFAWHSPVVRTLYQDHAGYATWALVWPLVLAVSLAVLALAGGVLPDGRRTTVAVGALLTASLVLDLGILHYRLPGYKLRYADIIRAEAVLHPKMVALREELHRTGERVLARDGSQNQFLLPNLTRPWNVPAVSGSGSLGIERYVDVFGLGGPGDVSPAALSMGHRGLDLFATRYVLIRLDSPLQQELREQPERWSAIETLRYYEHDPDTHYTLFRNARARPHAWCVPALARLTAAEALGAIRVGRLPGDAGEFDPARVALVDSGELADWQGDPAAHGSEVLADADRRQYAVRAEAPCMLVLSEVYYPWWRATIDGAEAQVARVNYTMVGIPVPSGTHVIRARITPVSVWAGAAISGVSVLLWAALVMSGLPGRSAADRPVAG